MKKLLLILAFLLCGCPQLPPAKAGCEPGSAMKIAAQCELESEAGAGPTLDDCDNKISAWELRCLQ